ncbi:MAG: amidohydrolase family protein [Planctomycetes bacterium]|nr:amidohydrolase family protein [Planctomycetota bacterium]
MLGATTATVCVAQTPPRALKAAAIVAPDGSIQTGGKLVLRDGVIEKVGGDLPGDIPVDSFDGGVICPGLIDSLGSLSALGSQSESETAIQPGLRGGDALDRFHPHLRAALEAGVTAFALGSDDENIIGGRIAICSTDRSGGDLVIQSSGPMKLSLSPAAFVPDRDPTSRSGAVGALRAALSAARDSKSDADPLKGLVSGKVAVLAVAPNGADVLSLLQLGREFGLKLALVHSTDARDVAGAVGKGGNVIVGPLLFESSEREATAAAVFEAAKVNVAIGGGLPVRPADSLRIGAAVAARNGLSPAAARRAVTIVPAEILGVADRIGSIQAGRRADLVVFSGDPLDLRSRVIAVYVAGRRVDLAQKE